MAKKRDRLAECVQSCRENDKSVPRLDLEWAIREIRRLRKAVQAAQADRCELERLRKYYCAVEAALV